MNDLSSSFYKSIPGFPGYKIGKDGSVWSCRKRRIGWRRLRGNLQQSGSVQVTLCNLGRQKVTYVHILVLEAFQGPCPPQKEACHWDDDASNNHLSNLRWDTHKSNMQDARRNGKRYSKLKEVDVLAILRHPESKQCQFAKKFGVHETTINGIRHGRRWKHLTGRG